MAGRKVFTSGEILTAADVNSFLMNQVVAVFADDDARSSAIPSPSEGMVTFREDQDVVEVFDGSAFKTVGGLVAVKSALKTDTFTASVGAGANVAVTDLSITHEVSDPANKVLLFAQISATNSNNSRVTGLVLTGDGSALALGDDTASRTRTGGNVGAPPGGRAPDTSTLVLLHSPATVASVTYGVNLVNVDTETNTLFVNRAGGDDDARSSRPVCSLTLMEVAV